jgi:hypothetical protein
MTYKCNLFWPELILNYQLRIKSHSKTFVLSVLTQKPLLALRRLADSLRELEGLTSK